MSGWKDTVQLYYTMGIYTPEEVQMLVPGLITQQDCDEILKA